MKYKFKRKPMDHQREALVRAIKTGYIGLLWEPGTGKSKVMVDWASVEHLRGRLNRVLIIAPLSVLGVWEDAFEDDCPVPYRLTILDKKDEPVPIAKGKLNVLVANYDRVWRRNAIIEKFDPEMVVADESQRIKKASAERSWYLRSLRNSTYRSILTGTPSPKSLLDLYSQWVFLNPRRFGTNIARFKSRYILFGGYMSKKVVGYYHVGELKKKVRLDASIKRKEEVLDLPEQIFQRVPVRLEGDAQILYDKLANELYHQFESGEIVDIKNAGVKCMRLQQITGGFLNTDKGIKVVSRAKMEVLEDKMEDLFYMGERVVVIARFRPELDEIERLGLAAKVPTYRIRGGIKERDRTRYRRDFQSKPGPSLMVLQIQSGGLGITLHASANAIFYSTTYALDDYIQASDRLHRRGQTRDVTYRQLVCRNTVDGDIYAALRAKKNVMALIMGKPQLLIMSDKEKAGLI